MKSKAFAVSPGLRQKSPQESPRLEAPGLYVLCSATLPGPTADAKKCSESKFAKPGRQRGWPEPKAARLMVTSKVEWSARFQKEQGALPGDRENTLWQLLCASSTPLFSDRAAPTCLFQALILSQRSFPGMIDSSVPVSFSEC